MVDAVDAIEVLFRAIEDKRNAILVVRVKISLFLAVNLRQTKNQRYTLIPFKDSKF